MNFFESELRKIVEPEYPTATFVGRACYVQLSDQNRAKTQFVTCGTANHYEALQIDILNFNEGQVDKLQLRFSDVWGKGQVQNLSIIQDGPYIWTYNGKSEWYAYHPTSADYSKLRKSMSSYLNVFFSLENQKSGIDALIEKASAHGAVRSVGNVQNNTPER